MGQQPAELLGVSERGQVRFPLLLKFIDAIGRLSLQVHPDDAYASKAGEGEGGKTEAWYVIRAEPRAWVVHGLREGVSLESFEKCLKEGNKDQIESCLNFFSVKSGDFIFIPPGTLHAAGDGLILLEVQQNSDLTYRVYDWDNNRPLQIKKALEVVKFVSSLGTPARLSTSDKAKVMSLLECDKFTMELIELEKVYEGRVSGFHILTFINGHCDIYYGKGERLEAGAGDNILIPSALNGYYIQPRENCRIVRTYITRQ
jgi:mannose-6-phosphate isomerase